MKMKTKLTVSLLAITAISFAPVLADEKQVSTLSIPINISLSTLENKLNAQIPNRIVSINQRHVCAKARNIKVPHICFKHGLPRTCSRQLRVTPRISCTVKGYVDKRGPPTLSGSGNTFKISLPIKAHISGRALKISQSANAAATFFVSTTPILDENWNISLNVKSDYKWDRKPELMLFNLIKIRVTGLVDPKLKEALSQFNAKIPEMIKDIQIRSKIEKAWKAIQQPIKIAQQPETYLIFKPTHTGFSGFSIKNKTLNARISIAGETLVTIGIPKSNPPIPLLPLKKESLADTGFNIIMPTLISAKEIQTTIDKKLNKKLVIKINEKSMKGVFSAKDFKISVTKNGGILLKSNIQFINENHWYNAIDFFNWFSVSGQASIEILPRIDEKSQKIVIEKITISSATNNPLADILVDTVNLSIVKNQLIKSLDYDYSEKLTEALAQANKALNEMSNKDITINGKIAEVGARKLRFVDGFIAVDAYAKGNIQVGLTQN